MPQLRVNIFTTYALTQQEEETGQVFTLEQKRVLQNKLADIAQDKLNTLFTPNDVLSYTQKEAELRGQMNSIQWLLDTSDEIELQQASRLAEQQQQQSE